MKPKVIDLFSGVGGFSLGFEKAGFDIVLANEYDAEIAKSYMFNHPSTKMIIGDITDLDYEHEFSDYVGGIDVIVGGPPCQGFSQKGQRKTILDERNFLFQYFVKAVSYIQPKYFVMENVPNLFTSEKGFFKNELENLFNELGYDLSMGVMNASDYGVPQHRRRAIVIGKKHGKPPLLPPKLGKSVTIWDAISDLAYLSSGEGAEQQEYLFSIQSSYQELMRRYSDILYNHIATNHSSLALERLALIPPNGGKEFLPKEHLTKSIYSGTWSRMVKDEMSVTITTRFDTPSSGKFTHPFLNRAITVREAARIQSFPDFFRFIGSKSSQMKQVGNAVPPLMAQCIASAILDDLKLKNLV
ncbi:DNA cytosine methyltransferase [Exiguobacterium sp. OS-77]|uniref:DNA cytosine methyltransferase n=1 Tax=Exiguobacterium sp. OS-77 TaxID=1241306 RepID=UPI0004024C6E|nr:DNA cytosine methyltransferase [Exiguobacterium sp. OS-77]